MGHKIKRSVIKKMFLLPEFKYNDNLFSDIITMTIEAFVILVDKFANTRSIEGTAS